MTTYDILGSCVSRDPFAMVENDYKLHRYFARTSLISLYSEPINIALEDIKSPSAFQQRMLHFDLTNNFRKYITYTKSDYIILDFIDERMDLLKHKNSYITVSTEFKNSNLKGIYKGETVEKTEDNLSLWEEHAKKFINEVKKYKKPNQIILHKAFWKEQYYTKSNELVSFDAEKISQAQKYNRILEHYYSFIEKEFEGIQIIEPKGYYADENHKWGLSPFHYESAYYNEFMKQFSTIQRKKAVVPYINPKERVFKGELDIKYIFEKTYQKTKNLMIVFSGMPDENRPPSYNYGRTLSEFDCNKLFIADDFGCRASYYLCKNRDYAIERSIKSLIDNIIKEHDITNIIACGSGKGGYAALYYGIKYDFNHIIVGSPQVYLGDYLLKQTTFSNMAAFIAGGTNQDDLEYLNSILPNMISKTVNKPNIFIHLGAREWHYRFHVKPLIQLLEQKNIDYTLDLGDYDKHGEVGVFFPPVLKQQITETLGYPTYSLKPLVSENKLGGKQTFVIETDSKSNKIAWYLYHDNTRIDGKNFSTDNFFTFNFEKEGKYEVKSFVINDKGMKRSKISDPILIKK
ncbi:DUF6270 domain-containing protein [Bacillus sp. SD-4]|nr:DUF6270 domain-containing protein [Bacillus sp. SD-4]